MAKPTPVPVVLDTDIGTDIDDTWALAMLLNSPELELRAAVSAHADTRYRAALLARMLERARRSDVAVGIGVNTGELDVKPQAAYLGEYDLGQYSGEVDEDGVGLLIRTIMDSSEQVTLLCIGPATNVAAALQREPEIVSNARFVGMHGAVRRGYRGSAEPVPEYNVFTDVPAFREVLAADWEITLTPLDTCGTVFLTGERYARLLAPGRGVIEDVLNNYRAWAAALDVPAERCEQRSTTLYDTVAVYLSFAEELLQMETINIDVADDGLTFEVGAGRPVRTAVDWRDRDAFDELLVSRLLADSLA